MNESKFKVIIKGQNGQYSVKTSGNVNDILTALTQTLVDMAIEVDTKKTKFLEIMKATYEQEVKERKEKNEKTV